ncbi:MAG: hypothetical protein A2736_00885 [Candidatus Yanofskybacteria bacterium RIFCSPHIGHO2_01_FULL_41_27]|uniref:Uncharacterized protein n=4 Tax=Parcubacteria group TaxID=1794811 RepID=A0A1F8HVE7_9BACT|nr:MAG: hypothetical protein UU83_C0022G0006 [Candidatus Jorgensenbacteria bacterium GW2011_GWF2_41_8]KKS25747.1 MAG: hypothetical protein UU84_C0039G0007 [Candidatus Yanofskybacteria bacterium GW2011_GWC2_41_9]OGN00311.1 MAG: hypothetical protein A2736_00885 [Candidatus Yanofskybacteria bacterium RIFCSPHIGHO2_01_FULL_41_27]OGN09269.1 MAG: hypothetical protein A3C64_01620 [Candidatus Yanofskybacteria bacterium RIFCSPHIGHO2_02_FULL_41_12]OGN19930.1 MAG: hypothetical protein A3B00_00310 [Candidat
MEIKLEDEHARKVCGLGNGVFVCSFLAISSDGFECLRGSDAEEIIYLRRLNDEMNALGINCSGPPNFVLTPDFVASKKEDDNRKR